MLSVPTWLSVSARPIPNLSLKSLTISLIHCSHSSIFPPQSQVIEARACSTYQTFLERFETQLKQLPVPEAAVDYYEQKNPYWLHVLLDNDSGSSSNYDDGMDATLSHRPRPSRQRRRRMESLYDTFCNIRDDEKQHENTLCNLVQNGTIKAAASDTAIQSTTPSTKKL
jgi:hypothetical protein